MTFQTPVPISQRIESAQAELNRVRDRLEAMTQQEAFSTEEQKEFEQLPQRVEMAERNLETWQKAEKALTKGALAVRPAADIIDVTPAVAPAIQKLNDPFKKVKPVDYIFRAAAAHTFAFRNQIPVHEAIARIYPDDELLPYVAKAAVAPGTTTTAGWAAELVETVQMDFLNLLVPNVLYSPLAARGTRFNFGRNGTIKVPTRASTPTVAGAFVLEGDPIPVKKIGLSSFTVTPKKLAVITTWTTELSKRSTPDVEALLRECIVEDTFTAIDTQLIDATAVSTARPAGLRNGVSAITASAATDKTQAMIADLKALIGALLSVNGGRNIVVMLNPVQALGINLAPLTTGGFLFDGLGAAASRFNVTFVQSTTVTAAMVIAVDAADFATITGDVPEFRISEDAVLHMEDTTPLAIGTVGAPATVAAPARSLFQTDTVGIRMVMDMNWLMRRTGMVAWTQSVLW